MDEVTITSEMVAQFLEGMYYGGEELDDFYDIDLVCEALRQSKTVMIFNVSSK